MKEISRHISRPLMFMGFELNDLMASLILCGLCMEFDLNGLGLLLLVLMPAILRRVKNNRPRGIVIQLAYSYGFTPWKKQGFLPPPQRRPNLSAR